MHRNFTYLAILAGFFVALSLSGCGKSGESAGPTSAPSAPVAISQPSAALDELKLGYFANATHAQAVLGVSSGDFQNAIGSTKLSTKVFNAGPSLIEALFAGEVNIGYIGPGPTISAYSKSHGEGVRVISGAAANGVVIVARKDSGITSLKDLVGKRIATPQLGNTQDIAAKHYLTAELGQKDTSNIIPVANAEQSGLMARGQIDAAWAPEPWGARLVAETGGTIIAQEKDLWPDKEFSLTVIITTPEFLKAHPDIVQKVLAVHEKWTKKLNDDPAGTTPLLEEALSKLSGGKKFPPGVLAEAVSRTKFVNDPLEETFKSMAGWSFDLGFAKQKIDLTDLFDLSILKSVEQSAAGR